MINILRFAYTGFESSSYAISETKNPAKNVPASLIISIFFIMTTYCSSSLALNLIQPFDQIDPHAPYPTAFHSIYPLFVIVSIGPLISLSGTLFTSIYSTVRVAYTMANDGLLFSSLASINPHTQVPNTSTIISALVSISLVVAIDVRNLVGFTDITAFLTYSATALSLLIVRYCNDDASTSSTTPNANLIVESSIDSYSSLINEQNDDENSESELNENLVSNLPLPKKQGLLSFIRKWKFLRIRDNIFSIILLIFLTNVTYFGLLEHFNTIKTTLITLIIVTNIIFVIILTIVEQIKPPITLSFKVKIN